MVQIGCDAIGKARQGHRGRPGSAATRALGFRAAILGRMNDSPVRLQGPHLPAVPLVLDSPHSGLEMPPALKRMQPLDRLLQDFIPGAPT